MSPTKAPALRKPLNYEELRQTAFGSPGHDFSLADLRIAAYRKKTGKPYPPQLAAHLATCDHCQRELALLQKTDPLLTGEDERLKVIIHAAQNPAAAEEIKKRGTKAMGAAVGSGSTLSAAAALIKSFFSTAPEKEEEKEGSKQVYAGKVK